MKSRTSFFNGAMLRKDIVRFAPVWVLYTIVMLIAMWLNMGSASGFEAHNTLHMLWGYMSGGSAVVNFFYALIVAAVLFGDLYVPRMCNALHAMPLRREGWFLTHTAAGVLFSVVPNLLALAIVTPVLADQWLAGVLCFATSTLQFLFFFGTASFCAMCAGNRLGLVACYGIFHFASILVYAVLYALYIPRLYGVVLQTDPFFLFSPPAKLASISMVNYRYVNDRMIFESLNTDAWTYLLIVTALGAALWIAAMLLYRRRHLERAGDLLAVRAAEPVFLLIATFAGGIVFYSFSELFGNRGEEVILLVGMAVGFFVARMLMERTVRVFRPGTVGTIVILMALTVASLYVTTLDPMGIVTRVPAMDRVESCSLDLAYLHYDQVRYREPEDIAKVMEYHGMLYSHPDDVQEELRHHYGDDVQVKVAYQLRDGKTMERVYHVSPKSELGKTMQAYLSSPRVVLHTDDLQHFRESVTDIMINYWEYGDAAEYSGQSISGDRLPELLDAILADCEEGNMAQDENFYANSEYRSTIGGLTIAVSGQAGRDYIDISIPVAAEHTIAALQDMMN